MEYVDLNAYQFQEMLMIMVPVAKNVLNLEIKMLKELVILTVKLSKMENVKWYAQMGQLMIMENVIRIVLILVMLLMQENVQNHVI